MKIETARWVRKLLEAHGIQIITWNDGTPGLLNVPSKWCAIISDLTEGLALLGEGRPLPEITRRPTKGRRR